MSDMATVELALVKVELQLAANIKALSTGRNMNVYATDVNNLLTVKANLENMITPTGNDKLIECEVCGEVTKQPVYNRWHGKNCKKK
tara:strand:+ start:748 stop:1008 length:261 start_codon:yes stop_codon:yes gene_type:complete